MAGTTLATLTQSACWMTVGLLVNALVWALVVHAITVDIRSDRTRAGK